MIHAHAHPDPPLPYGGRRGHDPKLIADAVRCEGLSACHPGAPPVLAGVNVRLPPGCRAALVGANGAGKSTLLKTVAGLLAPACGRVEVFGHAPGLCHHRTGYLPQRGEIDWRFPVDLETLVMAGRYVHLGWLRRPRQLDRDIVRKCLERLDLLPLGRRQIGELSGGQQQRALIARALAQGADLLLFDEPFNNLDSASRAELWRVFDDLSAVGKSMLVATHDLGDLGQRFTHVIRVGDGSAAIEGGRAWTG